MTSPGERVRVVVAVDVPPLFTMLPVVVPQGPETREQVLLPAACTEWVIVYDPASAMVWEARVVYEMDRLVGPHVPDWG